MGLSSELSNYGLGNPKLATGERSKGDFMDFVPFNFTAEKTLSKRYSKNVLANQTLYLTYTNSPPVKFYKDVPLNP